MPGPQIGPHRAFTCRYGRPMERLITPLALSDIYDPRNPPDPLPPTYETMALWDTGATRSVITPATARVLGIAPTGMANVVHAGGQSEMPTYVVNFILPAKVLILGVSVTECHELVGGDFGVIVGMDIIAMGDLSITNLKNQTTMTFRIPSMVEHDYAGEADRAKARDLPRNDPCWCGSGRKYKHCHGKPATPRIVEIGP